ncbi:MAG: protein kinase [Candidatus Saccharimonas sp.]|nr:protein kinase [Planctomycetaceae bacterium]
MLLTCPICRAECTVDDLSADTVTCPTCGQQLSTRTGTPVPQIVGGDTPAAKDDTLAWSDADVLPTADFDVLPVRLGRYFIERLIAQGGFAKVYLAMDEELGRHVALKIPRLERFKTPAKLRQFLAEARIASKLRHPGIITIFDVGQFANGTNYISMEYVPGQSLSDLMNAERIPVPRAVDLLIKIADAVHYAHGQGLVHRDLKPGNVLIDDRGEPRVVDFGLAVHETAQGQLRGEVAGTPPYMSPEQFRGEVHRLDGRADIWSLGVVLYQLLTGRRPFNGDVKQLYDEVLHKAPKPPRQIDDQIPRELESICFKCLSKSVDDRYSTARDLSDDLREWLTSQPATEDSSSSRRARPPNSRENEGRGRVRRRLIGICVALLLCTSAVLLAVSLPFGTMEDDLKGNVPPVAKIPQIIPSQHLDLPVDARAKPFIWLPLLDREPVQLVWGGDDVNSSWKFNAERQDITVDAEDILMASLGETKAGEYQLKVVISKNAFSGSAGLFWGYSAMEPTESGCDHRCQAIFLYCDKEVRPPVYQIRRSLIEFLPTPHRVRPSITENSLGPVATIDEPDKKENELVIDIRQGTVFAVRWRGNVLPELTDDPEKLKTLPPLPRGRFGIWNNNGASRFHDAHFKFVSP